MQMHHSHKQEAAEDIFFGQIVIIWARWFIILAGVIFALWLSTDVTQLSIAILLLTVIMGVNFFVHGRYLMEKPINRTLLLALSVVDLTMVTVIIWVGPGQNGLQNQLFIFYYPLLVSFAFVFSPTLTAVYTVVALMEYIFICVVFDPSIAVSSGDLETLVMRLITMSAMGFLGTHYWRIQRDRRQAVLKSLSAAAS